jgi:hypothetical protein
MAASVTRSKRRGKTVDDSGWFLLTFHDDEFLGALVIHSRNWMGAVFESHKKKLNPGGMVQSSKLSDDKVPSEEWRNRLLTLQEALDLKLVKIRS